MKRHFGEECKVNENIEIIDTTKQIAIVGIIRPYVIFRPQVRSHFYESDLDEAEDAMR